MRRTAVAGIVTVCALALYGAVGHAAGTSSGMEAGMAEHGVAGFCLVVFTLLAPLALPARARPVAPAPPARRAARPTLAAASAPVARARASPAWLQRFLH